MNFDRRAFLQLAAGASVAVGLGVKTKAEQPGSFVPPPPPPASNPFGSIEICGVPIYCDQYCPEHSIYVLKAQPAEHEKKNGPIYREFGGTFPSTEFTKYVYSINLDKLDRAYVDARTERELCFLSIVGAVKRHGHLPDCGVVGPTRWGRLMRQELERGQGHRHVDAKSKELYPEYSDITKSRNPWWDKANYFWGKSLADGQS